MISGTQIYNKALQDAIDSLVHRQPCTCNFCKAVIVSLERLKK